MRTILCLLWAATAWAGGIETSPRMPDVLPGNGIFEEGSRTNPYVSRDAIGREIPAPHREPGDGIQGYDADSFGTRRYRDDD